jgi:hypothetical protein
MAGLGVAITVDGVQDEELTAASHIEVYEAMGETTTYRIRYAVEAGAGDLPLLHDGRLDPGAELAIFAEAADGTHCLVKGPVHGQRITLKHGVTGSWVEVLGSDTSVALDRETKLAVWASGTDSDAVRSILDAPGYEYELDAEDTLGVHAEEKHSLVQCESDLRFIRKRARLNGFLFWVSCDEEGNETAHFRRPPVDSEEAAGGPGLPIDLPVPFGGGGTPKLVINLADANLQELEISWDVERPTQVDAFQLDLNTKGDLDGSVAETPQTILGDLGLQDVASETRSISLTAPADDVGDLQSRAEGAVIEADWFIRASCETSAHALGGVVRSHTLVELDGAGPRHSGTYFVAGVRHLIDVDAHRMQIELVRNGWGEA